jgi:PPP family 3-phenylpropionic acid transporter
VNGFHRPLAEPRLSTAEFRRYALFYLGYFGMLGAYTPYIGRWVSANGHGGYAVGAMLALWYGGRILAPPTWARQVARRGTGWSPAACWRWRCSPVSRASTAGSCCSW